MNGWRPDDRDQDAVDRAEHGARARGPGRWPRRPRRASRRVRAAEELHRDRAGDEPSSSRPTGRCRRSRSTRHIPVAIISSGAAARAMSTRLPTRSGVRAVRMLEVARVLDDVDAQQPDDGGDGPDVLRTQQARGDGTGATGRRACLSKVPADTRDAQQRQNHHVCRRACREHVRGTSRGVARWRHGRLSHLAGAVPRPRGLRSGDVQLRPGESGSAGTGSCAIVDRRGPRAEARAVRGGRSETWRAGRHVSQGP